jgi:hypothetical protein
LIEHRGQRVHLRIQFLVTIVSGHSNRSNIDGERPLRILRIDGFVPLGLGVAELSLAIFVVWCQALKVRSEDFLDERIPTIGDILFSQIRIRLPVFSALEDDLKCKGRRRLRQMID